MLITSIVSAQINISFEASEGYTLGSLHAQNTWEVTEGSDGITENQTVSDEQASDGTYSFKNGHEPAYDFQWFPIFGGAYVFDTPIASDQSITFSYDIMVTGQNGADFEFTLYGINAASEFAPVAGVGVENRGFIYLTNSDDYDFVYAESTWEPNQWMNIKVEITPTNISFYMNDVLDTTIARFNDLDIHGFNMLHNNYGNDAYYDNIVLTMEELNTVEVAHNTLIKIHPNPTSEKLYIDMAKEDIKSVNIYNVQGKLVAQAAQQNVLNVAKLTSGSYFIEILTLDGQKIQKKFLKK